MRVLVDTVVWSLAFRRRGADLSPADEAVRTRLQTLFGEGRASMIGPVRQELLTGIRNERHFAGLRDDLRSVPDEELTIGDFEYAAEISNRCRKSGLAASATDALLCSVAIRREWQLFTLDRDFQRYSTIFPLTIF
jgi:predicted nucleic acid-binding protein